LVVDPKTATTGLAALTATTGKAVVVEGNLSAIGGSLDITSAANAYDGLQKIDTALQVVNAARSNMGAIISRLQFATDNLANVAAKAQESRSRIEDTDYSIATTELAKRNIIQQAAQAMLAQANQAPQLVLQLLK
jgi:flagellin